ncbi:MAG: family 20 glycosylhydrolase [Bacteroidales bacterium]
MKKTIFFFAVIIPSIFLCSCGDRNGRDYPAADEIILEWEFKGNQSVPERTSSAVFIMENQSDRVLGRGGWALYYNQMLKPVIDGSVTAPVKFEHINGDWMRIIPEEGFLLQPGDRMEIAYDMRGWLIKEVEAPQGLYFVYNGTAGNDPTEVPVESYTIRPFPPLDKVFPRLSGVALPDASWVYRQNREMEMIGEIPANRIIPTPENVTPGRGSVRLEEGLMIHFEEGLEQEAAHLAKMIRDAMGIEPVLMINPGEGPHVIRLTTDGANVQLDPESYRLTASPEAGIMIVGGDGAGVFYGIQSLLAMLPVEVWGNPEAEIEINAVTISDTPAFAYRGMHLDLARNYIRPAAIRKLIQIMAFYKMNRLHLHLTEDEGWRLEIEELPELTEVGGYRGHTNTSTDHLIPAYGSGPFPDPEQGFGSGFLSRNAFIDILKFADQHHIKVIPEINMPGHARAAIYAMEARYRRLMEEGKPEEAAKYRLIDPADTSVYNSAQNFDDNVVCVCKEAPYLFYETVVDDLMEMYMEAGLELEMIHTGGDEVPHGAWEGSPECVEFLSRNPGIGGVENLQAYFGSRLFAILERKGLTMAGWEEIAMERTEEGEWVPNPEFSGGAMIPYVWNSLGENLDLGYRLANGGYPVILCNVDHFYFDLAYSHHPSEPGLYWGGFVNTRDAFLFAPYNVYRSAISGRWGNPIDPEEAFRGMERLQPGAYENILGIQGELWSETIKGGEMLEYYYLPKMLGLAERAWSGQPSWASAGDLQERISAMDDDWNEFACVVGQREMPRLDHLFGGYGYRLPPPGAEIRDGKLSANSAFPGLTIRYTTDGSRPDGTSMVYEGPVEAPGQMVLRTFDTRGRGSRASTAREE